MQPLIQRTKNPDHITRPYEKRDRERIRFICCETGFLGEPIGAVFNDGDLFADYLTRYYTDVEPESSWVGEKNGIVVGYLLGCKRWYFFSLWRIWNNIRLATKAFWRFVSGRYDAKSRKFLWWVLTRGWRETPQAPPKTAHFHFNSLKGHRKMGIARDLLLTWFEELKKQGVKRVYGKMITYENRRTEKVYEYMGWKVIEKKRVTKYEGTLDKKIYLTTVSKN